MPASPGRRPKPLELRRLQGNVEKRALPPAAALSTPGRTSVPPAPMRTLGREGRALWGRVLSAGATWLDEDVDLEVLLILCERIDERDELRRVVMQDGNIGERNTLRKLEADILKDFASLGFTPVDRARLTGLVKHQSSPDALGLDQIIADRVQRSG